MGNSTRRWGSRLAGIYTPWIPDDGDGEGGYPSYDYLNLTVYNSNSRLAGAAGGDGGDNRLPLPGALVAAFSFVDGSHSDRMQSVVLVAVVVTVVDWVLDRSKMKCRNVYLHPVLLLRLSSQFSFYVR